MIQDLPTEGVVTLMSVRTIMISVACQVFGIFFPCTWNLLLPKTSFSIFLLAKSCQTSIGGTIRLKPEERVCTNWISFYRKQLIFWFRKLVVVCVSSSLVNFSNFGWFWAICQNGRCFSVSSMKLSWGRKGILGMLREDSEMGSCYRHGRVNINKSVLKNVPKISCGQT